MSRHNEPAVLNRRRLLEGTAALGGMMGVAGCVTTASLARGPIALAPMRAEPDRVFDIAVCLRPFRAAGPRLDAETVGAALVVHNYGHGGSGWSLSWGSSALAVRKAMASSPRRVAVIGCGALGLTSAILAQQAGAQVTIYARDELPDTRSARATGTWTPDSRIALEAAAPPGFGDTWEEMARISFKTYRRYIGLPGSPVEFSDRYLLSDVDPDGVVPAPDPLGFASYRRRIIDLVPPYRPLPAGATSFPTPYVRHASQLMFNITAYGHTLMGDFLAAGGRFVRTEFHAPGEIATLTETVVINCPGYGARSLWKDPSVVPVRGQISRLIPQPDVDYGVVYNGVATVPRRDGIVVQDISGGDIKGYGDDNETPDTAESAKAVATIAELARRMAAKRVT
ncbi:MAG TPA: FAD-binding oxidoreductase [Caulobacteraceae bacterium]